ncbi:MAG: 16S rRNA (guanine(527)-N(7))-methyltransferase RsmG [Jatrophihabitantaceae bacterium]
MTASSAGGSEADPATSGSGPATDSTPQAEPVVPAPPAVVYQRFGAATEVLARYAGWLAGAGQLRGLIGPREVPRLWERHLLNCVALAELLPVGERLVDIGSGAGLPGLAIACVRPDLRIDLVESMIRRTDFLTEVVADLDLADQVRVVRGRAEDVAVVKAVGSTRFVTARAVAPLDKLVRWTFPLLSPGGSLLALKGATAEAEVAEHAAFLRRSRAEVRGVIECGAGLIDPPTRVIELVRR